MIGGGVVSSTVLPLSELHWIVHPACSSDWSAQLQRCDGGFFHSPAGLEIASPGGEPLFAQLLRGHEEVVGVAAGVRRSCWLRHGPRHYYFPTLPALVGPARTDEVVAELARALRALGAAEVVFDSFDAQWEPGSVGAEAPARHEYVVSLERPLSRQVGRLRENHRRHLRSGEREGWTLRTLEGEDARALLSEVLAAAARRAAGRGDRFAYRIPPAAIRSPAPALTAAWGTRVFSAWVGATPLAAVLVGWANRCAYMLRSGATAEGYRRSASVWLHWHVMSHLADLGFTSYNIGGTPASAVRRQDPAYGLFRFKAGFGSQVVLCRGARWTFDSTHVLVHRFAAWAFA
jgi:GNAT acetyltransferase-like protein